MNISSKKAFTITELMIGAAISAVIGLTIMHFMSNAQRQSAITRCRGMLRQNVQIAARQLERDISSSRAKFVSSEKKYKSTIELGNGGLLTLEVPKETVDDTNVTYFGKADIENGDDSTLFDKVSYTISDGVLKRNGLKVAEYIKSIDIPENNDGISTSYDGKLDITIIGSAKPDGEKDEIEHKEQLIVAIRQLQNKPKEEENKHWKQRIDSSNF